MSSPDFTAREIKAGGVADIPITYYSRQYNYFRGVVVEEAISAADANRRFSLLLRGVREGRSYVVTSHGKPVARLIPAGKNDDTAAGARTALLSRLGRQPLVKAGRWKREELYEDDR
jgi:prevent-host-death family protein